MRPRGPWPYTQAEHDEAVGCAPLLLGALCLALVAAARAVAAWLG